MFFELGACMDIGLYKLKYPFRKLIQFMVPRCRNMDPNLISWALLPLAVLIALVYWSAPDSPDLYFLGILLCFLRMIVATLDGLVAMEFNKSSELGELVNRITPELSDLMLIPAIIFSRPEYLTVGVLAMASAWATTFFGLIGQTVRRPIQSVGPTGQTDRLTALMLFSFLAGIAPRVAWDIDFIQIFLWWCVVGGTLTCLNRYRRTLKAEPLNTTGT